MPGLILGAPASGSGKTTVTLGLLRAFSRQGLRVRGAKSGPDYIDPRFHEAACGVPCPNLDSWAMSGTRLRALAQGDGTLLIEGAMGLFDGAPPDGKGATADLASIFHLPVILIVDVGKMAQSVAPLVSGFAGHSRDVRISGVILNRVGSSRHEAMLRRALDPLDIPVLGALPRTPGLSHPSRHLGLVQAQERPDLDSFLEACADVVSMGVDLDAVLRLAAPLPEAGASPRMAPPAQRIALAHDAAFSFAYPHMLSDWRSAGSEIRVFSPLADDPVPDADMIFLPGGYPELYAGRLSSADRFLDSMRTAAEHTDIYGECGGFMTLGTGLTDAQGVRHPMAGLLRLETSFATRRLHLGYRRLKPRGGVFSGPLGAHEFHYATTLTAKGEPLFEAEDAEGRTLDPMGLRAGRVSGSFAHVIDQTE